MKLVVTERIRQFCLKCSKEDSISNELRQKASEASNASSIAWNDLKELVAAVNKNAHQFDTADNVLLHELCRGSNISLPQPPPKQGKSPELQAHLEKLQRQLDQKRYDKMVWEVIQDEKKAEARAEGGLKTYKQQITYGIHIILMMASFYIFGHIAGRALISNRIYHPIVGLTFMFFAMLMETTLYIIRTTTPPPRPLETTMKKLPTTSPTDINNKHNNTSTTSTSRQSGVAKLHNRQSKTSNNKQEHSEIIETVEETAATENASVQKDR